MQTTNIKDPQRTATPPSSTLPASSEPASIAEALMRLLESQSDALQLAGTPGPREQSLLSVLEAEEARLAREHAEQRARLVAGFAPTLRAAIDADADERARRRAEELRGLVALVTPLAAVFTGAAHLPTRVPSTARGPEAGAPSLVETESSWSR